MIERGIFYHLQFHGVKYILNIDNYGTRCAAARFIQFVDALVIYLTLSYFLCRSIITFYYCTMTIATKPSIYSDYQILFLPLE